jgi:hypothetical protein
LNDTGRPNIFTKDKLFSCGSQPCYGRLEESM